MSSRINRITRQVKRGWGELQYAQGRSFEVTTGIPVTPKGKQEMARAEIGELEAVLARPHAEEQPQRAQQPQREDQPILDPAPESVPDAVAI